MTVDAPAPEPAPSLKDRAKALWLKVPVDKIKLPKIKFKKMFGPFLLCLVIGLLLGYALVLRALTPSTSGVKLSLDQLYKKADEKLVITAEFKEQDANLLMKIKDARQPVIEPVAAPAPPAEPAPAAKGKAAPTTTAPPPPTTVPPPVEQPPTKVRSYWLPYPPSDVETGNITDKLIASGTRVTTTTRTTRRSCASWPSSSSP